MLHLYYTVVLSKTQWLQRPKRSIVTKRCVLVQGKNIRTMIYTGSDMLPESTKEDMTMALSNLAGWTEDKAASACGASDK